MNKKPDNYIDVSTIDTDNETVAAYVRRTVKRFHNQEFTWRHVFGVVQLIEKFDTRTGLEERVRYAVHDLEKRGAIVVVSRGKFGGDSFGKRSTYKNAEYVKNDTAKRSN